MFMIILWMVAIILAVVCILESAKRRGAERDLADAKKQIAEERKYSDTLCADLSKKEKELAEYKTGHEALLAECGALEKKNAKLVVDRDKIAASAAENAKNMNAALDAAQKRADNVEQRLFRNWTMVSNDGRVRTYMRDCIYMSCDGDTIVPISDKENDRITAIVEDDEIAGYYRPEHETVEPPEEAEVEAGEPNGEAVDLADFEDED